MTFASHITHARSQKIQLAWIEPTKRVSIWTLDSGSTYYRNETTPIVGVTGLVAGTIPLSSGEFYHDLVNGRLYVRLSGDTDPNNDKIYLTYRYCFANTPLSLPYDLDSGESTYYDGLLESASDISFDLDDENTGISIESNTSIKLNNTSQFFDSIYDKLFWENARVVLFNWNQSLAISEKQKLFQGTIEDKRYSSRDVSFRCKDQIYQLRKPVNLSLFSDSDGSVPDRYLNTPKRRLYGKFKQLQCVPVDATLSGFALTGNISASAGSTTVTGSGTSFLDECSPGDRISYFDSNGDEITFNVEAVNSDTSITSDSELDQSIPSVTAFNSPDRPWRKKNREWHIAGHKLRSPSTTIDTVIQDNRIEVVDPTDFFIDDRIKIGAQSAIIKRVVNSVLVLRQNLGTTPIAGQAVTKEPVSKAFVGSREAIIDRDFSITNTSTDCKLILEDDAEFNLAPTRSLPFNPTFTNGSRTVAAGGNADFNNYFKPRDWIRSTDITHTVWYEVLSVEEQSMEIRSSYAGSTYSSGAEYKNPELVADNSLVTVNCIGKESASGEWLSCAGRALNDIITNDAGLSVDSASFDAACELITYTLSLAIPEKIGGKTPKIRDVVNDINSSVFGSIYPNLNFDIKLSVLHPEKPTDIETVNQDDIISDFRVDSKNEIIKTVNASYRPFVDIFTGEDTFQFYTFDNEIVADGIGLETEEDITLYLYEEEDAKTIAQRYAFYKSLSRSLVSFNAPIKYIKKILNDAMKISFRRLYNRFGGNTREKIALINSIKKSESNVSITLNDLGNVFNRVPSVAPDDANDFSSSTDSEKLVNGFVLDDSSETPDTSSEDELNTGLIG